MSRLLIAALAVLVSCGRGEPRSGSNGTASSPPTRAATQENACGRCHVEETRTWEKSLHHRSFTDADFQASFTHEREAFCIGCHAPNAKGADDPRVAEGVSCVSCHAVARDDGDGRGVHPIGRAKSCESCHDFSDPDRVLALQKTSSEHERSPFRDVTCAGCHMNARDHGFAASRDLDRLRAAVDVSARAEASGQVEVTVRPRRVGHAFPTGDLFRRVRVFAYRETAAGRIVATDERAFERTFEPGTGHRRELADTRLEGDTRFTLDLATRPARVEESTRVVVQLVYERGAARSGDDLTLFSSDVLAERTLELK